MGFQGLKQSEALVYPHGAGLFFALQHSRPIQGSEHPEKPAYSTMGGQRFLQRSRLGAVLCESAAVRRCDAWAELWPRL